MWLTIAFNVIKLVVGSDLLNRIRDLVSQFDKIEGMDGQTKWRKVWSAILNDGEVKDKVVDTAKYLINLAIEISVAIVRK